MELFSGENIRKCLGVYATGSEQYLPRLPGTRGYYDDVSFGIGESAGVVGLAGAAG